MESFILGEMCLFYTGLPLAFNNIARVLTLFFVLKDTNDFGFAAKSEICSCQSLFQNVKMRKSDTKKLL